MRDSQPLRDALDSLIARAVALDAKHLDTVMPELLKLVQEGNTADIRDYFKPDPKGLALFLSKGIPPTSFAGRRYAAMLPVLVDMLNAIYAHERGLVEDFLDGTVKGEERAKVLRSSLFMSPSIKALILQEWIDKPWKGHSLSARVWDFSKATEDSILRLVASKIAEGKGPKQIAPLVRNLTGQQSKYVVKRLLLTESSRIWHDVQSIAVSEFKHIKYVVLKYGNRHTVKCACTPYKDKGKILYSDAPDMPIHPNSSSYLQPVAG